MLHVSTAREVEIIRFFKAQGARVTCETAPHYWCLTDDACRGYNTNAKMNPPLRTQADCDAMIAGLAGRDDRLRRDRPCAARGLRKAGRVSAGAPFGIVGLETSLALGVTHLVAPGRLGMGRVWCALMATTPARILGLPGGTLDGRRARRCDGF